MNRKSSQKGFSIVELLVVVVIIGIVAAMAVPFLQRAIRGSEVGGAFATLRTVSSTQLSYFSQTGRFARITEANNVMSGAIGTQIGTEVHRGKFVFATVPPNPTDAELREGYVLTATRTDPGEGVTYIYELTQSGYIREVLP